MRPLFKTLIPIFSLSIFINAWADPACDAKAQAAALAKWSNLTHFSQNTVTGTQIVNQTTNGQLWTKTVDYTIQSGNAGGTVRVASSGNAPAACTIGNTTMTAGQNLPIFPANEFIALVENIISSDLNVSSNGCAVTYGFKKFLPHEYSQYASLQTKPNFFYVSSTGTNLGDTQPHYFKFDPNDTRTSVNISDFSSSHLNVTYSPFNALQNNLPTVSLEVTVQADSSILVSVGDGVTHTEDCSLSAPQPQ